MISYVLWIEHLKPVNLLITCFLDMFWTPLIGFVDVGDLQIFKTKVGGSTHGITQFHDHAHLNDQFNEKIPEKTHVGQTKTLDHNFELIFFDEVSETFQIEFYNQIQVDRQVIMQENILGIGGYRDEN